MSALSNEKEAQLRWIQARSNLALRATDLRNATVSLILNDAAKLATTLYERACEEFVQAHAGLPERMR